MSNSNPELIIIAGPNGAGKSTTSKEILSRFGVQAFDWDAEFYHLWGNKFNFDPAVEQGVRNVTTEKFEQHIRDAFKNKTNVSYETNFHVASHFKRAERAKKEGFNTILIFFFVDDIKICNSRVDQRHLLGGHYVDPLTVKHRWSEGLKRLNDALLKFDSVFIYDTSLDYEIEDIAIIKGKEIISYNSSNIDKVKKHLPNLEMLINS